MASIIRQICNHGIADGTKWDESTVSRFAVTMEDYYSDGNYNLYSSTYTWLSAAQMDDETAETLDYRLKQIEYVMCNKESRYIKEMVKLRDYIVLEAKRADTFDELKQISANGKTTLEKVEVLGEKLADDITKLKESTNDDRKNANTQSITVLSIFTGIAMTFFGTFSLLGSAFSSLGKENVQWYHISIISVIIGFILFNTIYALIFVACRISGTFPTQLDHVDCSKCCHSDCCDNIYSKKRKFIMRWVTKFRRKYPFAFAINAAFLMLLISFIIVA